MIRDFAWHNYHAGLFLTCPAFQRYTTENLPGPTAYI